MNQQEANREIILLKNQLQTTLQIKNNQIIELENQFRKSQLHIKYLDDKLINQEAEIRVLKQKAKELELFAKERSHALTHKNIKISQLEQQIQEVAHARINELQIKVEGLQKIIISQEQEINQYLNDHQTYLQQFEKMQTPYRYLNAERQLLHAFNSQLQNQISDVETANEQLQQCVFKAHQELSHQNEQSNDMLCQLQYMVDTVNKTN